MRTIYRIIIIFIMLCNLVYCFEYESHVSIKGDGSLDAESNLGIAKDRIDAKGVQNYDRFYLDREDRTIFVSNYNLSNPNGKGSRTYAFSSTLPGLTHYIKMSSDSTMRSINSVDRNEGKTETWYRDATLGNLTEEVVAIGTSSRPKSLAETIASGDIRLNSSLKSNATFAGDMDLDRLLNSLDSVKMYSEVARVEIFRPESVISLDGKEVKVKGAVSGTAAIGDIPVSYDAPLSIGSESENFDAIKENGVPTYTDIGDFRVIEPVPGAEALVVSLQPEHTNGSIGEIENFTVVLDKYGNSTTINQVSAEAMLPPGLDYSSSVNGTYDSRNRILKWSNTGPMIGDQRKGLGFRVRVNETIVGLTSLNISVSTKGTSSSGKVLEENDIFTFPLKQPSMTVKKSSNRQEVSTGDEITYSIEVRNTGEIGLEHIFVKDDLPFGMTVINSSPEANIVERYIVWQDIGPMPPGGKKTLIYTAKVSGSIDDGGKLTNNVMAEAWLTQERTLKINNSSQVVFRGTSSLENASASNIMRIQQASPDQSSNKETPDGSAGVPSNEPEMRLVIKSVPEKETKTADNADSVHVIDVKKTANETSVNELRPVIFTITIRNSGNSTLTNVSAEDTLPHGMIFINATPDPQFNDIENGILRWYLDPIEESKDRTLTYMVNFDGSKVESAKLRNNVTVKAKDAIAKTASALVEYSQLSNTQIEGDFAIFNETPEGSAGVLSNDPEMRLVIKSVPETETKTADNAGSVHVIDVKKTANESNVNDLSSIIFTITIRNSGNSTLTNVSAEDTLPHGMIFINATPDPQFKDIENGTLRWYLDPIEESKDRTLTYMVNFDGSKVESAKLRNNVTVKAKDAIAKTASAPVEYSRVSTMQIEGDFAIFQGTTLTREERVPLARETIHLGSYLIWDRKAYTGWKEIRKGDEYFAKNESDKDKIKSRIPYTPEYLAWR